MSVVAIPDEMMLLASSTTKDGSGPGDVQDLFEENTVLMINSFDELVGQALTTNIL
jgi:hypothetical protein